MQSYRMLSTLSDLRRPHKLPVIIGSALILGCTILSIPAELVAQENTATKELGTRVAALLAQNCIACHNAKKPEGGLNLESHAPMMKGGDSGAVIVSGDATKSSLMVRILSQDDPMPPTGNAVGAKRLSESEAAIVEAWIKAGAPEYSSKAALKLQWQPLPQSVHPINAMATSGDGNYLVLGRGNEAFVLRRPATSGIDQAFSLVDPAVADLLRNTVAANGGSPDPSTLQAAQLDIVQSVAFSPDSSRVAAGGYRSVKLWKRSLGALDSVQTGLTGTNTLMSTSPNGLHVAVSMDGRTPEVIHLPTYQTWRSLRAHSAPVTAMIWLADGNLLSGDSAGVFVLHRLDTNEKSSTTLGSSAVPPVKSLAVLAPDKVIAASQDGRLVLLTLDQQANTIQSVPIGEHQQINRVVAGTAGPIALGLENGLCRLLKRDDFALIRDLTTAGPVQQLAISQDGKLVVTSTGAAPAQLWRSDDGATIANLERDYHYTQLIAAAQRSIQRHQGLIERLNAQHAELKKAAEAEVAALAKVQEMRDKAAEELSKQDGELAAANQAVVDGQKAMADAEAAVAAAMKMVETRKTELAAKQKAVVDAQSKKDAAMTQLASRDQALATSKDASNRATARVPEIESSINSEKQKLESLQQESQQISNHPENKHQAKQLSFAADGSRVVVSDELGRLHLFDSTSGNPEANLLATSPTSAINATLTNRLISLSNTGTMQQWDLNLSWTLERVIGDFENSPFSDRITALDFSPDGKRLAVGSGPPSRFGDLRIVDVESGEVVKDFGEVHSDTILSIRYSPDGRKLASGGADKLCRILDVESGKTLVSLEGHTHHVLSVAWKDDGVTLATGSADQNIKIWNVDTGTQSRTIGGSKKEITSLTFVAQSNQFLAADASGTIRLLDAGGGNQVRAFGGAEGTIQSIAVSPDGKLLFAGGQAGHSWAWQVDDAKKLR